MPPVSRGIRRVAFQALMAIIDLTFDLPSHFIAMIYAGEDGLRSSFAGDVPGTRSCYFAENFVTGVSGYRSMRAYRAALSMARNDQRRP